MAAVTDAKQPRQTASPRRPYRSLEQARDVARECFAGWKLRASFDAKTMRRLEQLADENPWLTLKD
jgi:hypothetical protein